MLSDSPYSNNILRPGDQTSRMDSSSIMPRKPLFASELKPSSLGSLTNGLSGLSLGGPSAGGKPSGGGGGTSSHGLYSGSLGGKSRSTRPRGGLGDIFSPAATTPTSAAGGISSSLYKKGKNPSLPVLPKTEIGTENDLLPSGPKSGRITKDWTGHEVVPSKPENVSADRFIAQRTLNGALNPPPSWGGAGESMGSLHTTEHSAPHRPSPETSSSEDPQSLLQQADVIRDSLLVPTRSLTDTEEQQAFDSAARSAAALGIDFSSQVLSFAPRPPPGRSTSIGPSPSGASAAAVRQRRLLNGSSLSCGPARRPISNKPEKVLDAAEICDDFYYNLMDWSVINQVAIALRGRAFIWDCEEAEVYALVDMAEEPERVGGNYNTLISAIKWHPDGNFLAVATDSGYTQIWDTVERRRVRTLKPHPGGGTTGSAICTMGWADATTLTVGYDSGLVVDHDIRLADSTIRAIQAHAGCACGLLWRDDGGLLATGGNDNIVKVWDRHSTQPIMSRSEHTGAVKAMSWSPFNNNILATGGGSACRTVNIWNVETDARLKSWTTEAQISSLHWSWYHRELLTTHGSSDGSPWGSINIWSYPSGKVLHRIGRAHEGRILGSVLSPDGQKLASVDTGGNELRFWMVFEASEEQRRRHRQGKGLELYNPLKSDPTRSRTRSLLR